MGSSNSRKRERQEQYFCSNVDDVFEKNSYFYLHMSVARILSQFRVLYVDQTGLLQQGGVPSRACLAVMRDPVNFGCEISALSLPLPLSPVCSCIPAKKFLY